MKRLFFLSLAFLLFLSSEVSSQNQNMFDFEITCDYDQSPACNAMDIFKRAGQIFSDNLILTSRIQVEVIVTYLDEVAYIASTEPRSLEYGDHEGEIAVIYPTALIKQLNPNFVSGDLPDIYLTINSKYDSKTWYGGNEPIHDDQTDFLETILHELNHGLGLTTSWRYVYDDGIVPDYNVEEDPDTGELIFYYFVEDIFDKYLITLGDNGSQKITTYVQALNDMAGPSGRAYNNEDDFHNQLDNEQQKQGKSYTRDMLSMSTSSHKLGFLPKGASSSSDAIVPIVLDTHDDHFSVGTNIVHLDRDLYSKSPDFALTPSPTLGKTLQQKIEAYGNAPGGGLGPHARSLLESFGFKLRIPATSSTKRKSKRSKPKRIENYS